MNIWVLKYFVSLINLSRFRKGSFLIFKKGEGGKREKGGKKGKKKERKKIFFKKYYVWIRMLLENYHFNKFFRKVLIGGS